MSTKNDYKTSDQTDTDKSISVSCDENGCCNITINITCCGKPLVPCEPETPTPTPTPAPTSIPSTTPTPTHSPTPIAD